MVYAMKNESISGNRFLTIGYRFLNSEGYRSLIIDIISELLSQTSIKIGESNSSLTVVLRVLPNAKFLYSYL